MCVRGFSGSGVGGASRGDRTAAAAVVSSVALSGLVLLVFAPGAWWLITIYGWVVFPAFGVLGAGLSGTLDGEVESSASQERQLLEALERNGPLTPARAAMETSLSVSEAEGMLRTLADGGHLEVLVRGGGLFYSMWGVGEDVLQEDVLREDALREVGP